MKNEETQKHDQYYKVQTDRRLRIRESPSFDSKIIGFLSNNAIIHSTEKYGYWIHHDKGWSLSYDISTGDTFLIESSKDELYRSASKSKTQKAVLYDADDFDPNDDDGYSDDLTLRELSMRYANFDDVTTKQNTSSRAKSLLARDINGVFGIPYQFSELVDQPMQGSGFGRKYAEKIIAPLPVIFLSPGRPDFMKTFSSNDKESIVKSFMHNATGGKSDNLDDIIDGYGRYYTFKFAYDEYYTYVNHTLWMLATYMGIGNQKVTIGKVSNKRLDAIRWEDTLSTAFTEYVSAAEAIPFYLDSETSINESFSNSTTESMLAQKANSLSDMARELTFVLGDVKNASAVQAGADILEGGQDLLTSVAGDIAGALIGDAGKNFINRISSQFSTIVAGGKLDFPEIWSDSDFSRSFSINFKFRSPDADNLSIFLNLYVPLIHLICLAAPQQMGSNAFSSPFIVRGFYKGIFNCDYGMITGLNITKGKEGCWNANGLPTVIDVSLELKELYSSFYISQYRKDKFINNTMLIDYLLLMAGVNINKPELTRTLDTYLMSIKGAVFGTPGDVWLGLKNDISNIIKGYYKVK